MNMGFLCKITKALYTLILKRYEKYFIKCFDFVKRNYLLCENE